MIEQRIMNINGFNAGRKREVVMQKEIVVMLQELSSESRRIMMFVIARLQKEQLNYQIKMYDVKNKLKIPLDKLHEIVTELVGPKAYIKIDYPNGNWVMNALTTKVQVRNNYIEFHFAEDVRDVLMGSEMTRLDVKVTGPVREAPPEIQKLIFDIIVNTDEKREFESGRQFGERKYHKVFYHPDLKIYCKQELAFASKHFTVLEHKLFILLLAQINQGVDVELKAYEISARQWSDIIGLRTPAYSQLKSIAAKMGNRVISFKALEGKEITFELPVVEFIQYQRGKLFVKLDEALGPYVLITRMGELAPK